jgi:AcrR family transcriptional regulator
MARTGRRPGDSGTREAILDAAQRSFTERGYDGTTIRGVAKAAGVDPALVHHFYGHKHALFAAAMRLPVDPAELVPALLADGADGLGERVVRMFLHIWDGAADRSPVIALLRSAASNENAAAMLREFFMGEVAGPLTKAVAPDRQEIRASLVATQMLGLAFFRYVLRFEPIASADHATIIAAVGPNLQRYLAGDLG